jgi:hypothetical protein
VMLGTAIERGADAQLATPALAQFYLSWLPQLPVPGMPDDDNEDAGPHFPEPTPEQAAILAALPRISQSLVSHLARMPEERERLAADAALIERLGVLGSYSHGATWMREILVRTSGSLIVLHPPSGAGLQLRYENIATCFHLFSLVQAAIGTRLPGGRTPDPAIIAAATGQSDDRVSDEAWWHYGDPRSNTADLNASIWGEALVRSIPAIDGSQVMLLWPPRLQSRSWSSGFFGPHLEALQVGVTVENELAPQRCQTWFKTLGIKTAAPRRTWWPW